MNNLNCTVRWQALISLILKLAFIQLSFVAFNGGTRVMAACAPTPSGLIAWWPGEGTASDFVDGNNGTLMNGPSFAAGEVGQGFKFNGVNQHVQIPYTPSLISSNFTMEAWINPLSQVVDNPNNQDFIFGQAVGTHLAVRPGTTGVKVVCSFHTGNYVFAFAISTNEIPTNQFSHVAGTWDGTTLKVYVNGILSGTNAPGKPPIPSACPFYIGGYANACGFTGQFFNGIIDEVSYYSRSISAAEVQSIFSAGPTGKCVGTTNPVCVQPPSGLSGWWRGEGNGNDSTDGNNGTLVNGVSFAAGVVGQALKFNGVDQHVRIPYSANLVLSNFSIEAWVNPLTQVVDLVNQDVIFGQADGPQIAVRRGTSGVTVAAAFQTGVNQFAVVVSTNQIATNQFSHIAGTWDGATLKVYINGILSGTNIPAKPQIPSTCPFFIGGFQNACGYTGQFFNGIIDEVSLYNRSISAAEVQAIYEASAAGKCPIPVLACAQPPAGMVSWWKGNGNADDLVDGNNGVLMNGATFATGEVDQGFKFNGVDQHLKILYSANLISSNYSIEAWINPLSQVVDLVNQDLIFGQADGPQLAVRRGTSGITVATAFQIGVSQFAVAATTNQISTNQFSHIAGTWDGTTLKIYVNGILSGTNVPGKMPVPSTCPFYIGGFQNACGYTGQFFNGIIDEVSVYNRAISAAEVQAIYSAGTFGKCFPQFNDGIPDSWRLRFFGAAFESDPRAKATADPDGDGANNYQEFVAGTNPLDANSVNDFPLVWINPSERLFTNVVFVEIRSMIIAGVVHYTLDGATPTRTSPAYQASIVVTNTATVKAQVFINDTPVSEVASAAFSRIFAFAGDGIPDNWRVQYFGTNFLTDPRVAANADPDGDGSDNLHEYVAGTNPLDPLSKLTGDVRLVPLITWDSFTNKSYRVVRRDSLQTTNTTVLTPFIRATNTVSSFVDIDAPTLNGFYLIEVQP